jgi:hypothetical protein
MVINTIDNFLDDNYLEELNDVNLWDLLHKQDMKWVSLSNRPTNIFERIVYKEYRKTFKDTFHRYVGYEYWRVKISSNSTNNLPPHQDLDETLQKRTGVKKPASLSTVFYGYPHFIKGGNLMFEDMSQYEPKYNRLIYFNSIIQHQVLPVTLGDRYALSVNFWEEKPEGYVKSNFRIKKRESE